MKQEQEYKFSLEYKIILLHSKTQLSHKEISDILDIPIIEVSRTIAVEQFEVKRQLYGEIDWIPKRNSGKVKLN